MNTDETKDLIDTINELTDHDETRRSFLAAHMKIMSEAKNENLSNENLSEDDEDLSKDDPSEMKL